MPVEHRGSFAGNVVVAKLIWATTGFCPYSAIYPSPVSAYFSQHPLLVLFFCVVTPIFGGFQSMYMEPSGASYLFLEVWGVTTCLARFPVVSACPSFLRPAWSSFAPLPCLHCPAWSAGGVMILYVRGSLVMLVLESRRGVRWWGCGIANPAADIRVCIGLYDSPSYILSED